MDQDFINLITHIQLIKQELYKKHQPAIIDGTHALTEVTSEDTAARSKDYDLLMKKQRKLVYKKDINGQEKAEADMRTQPKERINLRSPKEDSINQQLELQKPWNKLSNNLKIQAILKFIESLSVNITDNQTNQLRYLLISAVSQRKLTKAADIDYDVQKGQINKICHLVFDGTLFKLSDKNENDAIGLTSFPQMIPTVQPPQPSPQLPPKKIVLIKKTNP
jgi:preprotein translocase subunit SecA